MSCKRVMISPILDAGPNSPIGRLVVERRHVFHDLLYQANYLQRSGALMYDAAAYRKAFKEVVGMFSFFYYDLQVRNGKFKSVLL